MADWDEIAAQLPGPDLGEPPGATPVGGGCINAGWRLRRGGERFFVKTNRASMLAMFEAELAGLEAMSGAGGIRVPRPLATGISHEDAWIAMEWIEPGPANARSETLLGEGLAQLHRATAATFGWCRDNTIGSTPQQNAPSADWPSFYAHHRLGFQLNLAVANGWAGELGDRGRQLAERVGCFFSDYRPIPSLLHGDLWGGNWATDQGGSPFVFDPAVYYGDREADLAMTELFGGFGRGFYDAYRSAWPLDPGYAVRRDLYNLYHVLNHLNLFGGGYLGRARSLIDRLLAEAGA
jgi:fructosamine-3-kinase